MKYTHKTTVELLFDNGSTNKQTLENTNIGGSETTYEHATTPPILGEQFPIKEVEQKLFQLGNTNNFSEDILPLLQTPAADITGIICFAYIDEDGKKQVPVRFDLTIKTALMGAAALLGSVSEFSLQNIVDNKITEFEISNVDVPADKVANLVVLVVSQSKNQP